MRSLVPALVRTALVGWLALALLASCSKKATAPNSFGVPEGQADGTMLMVAWPEQPSQWFYVADPATPETPSDDFIYAQGEDFWQGEEGLRSATLDLSPSNQLQVFRIGSDGNAAALFDFFLTPSLRIIGRDTDLYEFEDASPGTNPTYVSRGATSGVVTTSSPVTNEVRVTGPIADDLDFTPAPKGAVNDSVLNVHFTEDPRAAFYIVELNDASDLLGVGASASLERRTRGIASPLLPGSRSLHSVFTLMPRGTGLAGFDLTITSRQWPQAFHIRVTAYDYDGQLINRVNDYLRVDARDGNLILQGYEPLGGAVQLLDPYPSPTEPVPTPPVFSRAQVRDIYLAIGINTAPVLQSNLKFQATAGTAPPREIFNQLGQHERFSVETLKASVAQARQVLDNPPTGPLRGGRSVRARGR